MLYRLLLINALDDWVRLQLVVLVAHEPPRGTQGKIQRSQRKYSTKIVDEKPILFCWERLVQVYMVKSIGVARMEL